MTFRVVHVDDLNENAIDPHSAIPILYRAKRTTSQVASIGRRYSNAG
ncbi:MAG: hypothetical protein ACI9G5_000308 [Paracoccaceae bacterium]|jgi:hypothetical protein